MKEDIFHRILVVISTCKALVLQVYCILDYRGEIDEADRKNSDNGH